MKSTVKSWLHEAGLLRLAEPLYFDLKTASPNVLQRELRYRTGLAPDGYPVPPPALIYEVIACHWGAVYLDSGAKIVADMAATLKAHGTPFSACTAILDFGCGCGRLIRHVQARTVSDLFGSDYNPRLIDWCQRHLPFATFRTNELAPPLAFEENQFDLVYARSVFTHLPEDLQKQWMDEMRRVLQPGGYLYLTMHGRPLAEGLSAPEKACFEADELVVTYPTSAGGNLCASYASRGFVERELMDGFTLAAFLEGRDETHLRQDVYLLRRDS